MRWDTEVTTSESHHLVTQAYCSAVPVGYSPHSPDLWEPFARLVLEASYEATLRAVMLNASTGSSMPSAVRSTPSATPTSTLLSSATARRIRGLPGYSSEICPACDAEVPLEQKDPNLCPPVTHLCA